MSWLGAMQSQDYAGAKWAIGLRADVTDEDVERACDAGAIIRTHILRQTWHFVARDDIRWMLALSGPRVNAVNAHYYRKLKSRRAHVLAKPGGDRARAAGPAASDAPRAEGGPRPRRHRRRRPASRVSDHADRARCGCVQWSQTGRSADVCPARGTSAPREEPRPRRRACGAGATVLRQPRACDAERLRVVVRADRARRKGGHRSGRLERSSGKRSKASRTGLPADARRRSPQRQWRHLLPNYDEYLIAHKDRHLVVSHGSGDGVTRIKDPFVHHLVIDGRLAGSWTRTVSPRSVVVGCSTYARPAEATRRAIDAAIARLGRFMNLPATASWADQT